MTIGYKHDFVRRAYSRGRMRIRDLIWEGIKAPICVLCGKTIERGLDIHGRPMRIRDWLKKKTCSKQCYIEWRKKPENFPPLIKKIYRNLKSKLKCVECGKQLNYRGKKDNRMLCQFCYFKWRNTSESKKYSNKYINCTVPGCGKPHEGRGLCRYHYYHVTKKTSGIIGRPKGSKDLKKRNYPKNRKARILSNN